MERARDGGISALDSAEVGERTLGADLYKLPRDTFYTIYCFIEEHYV